jgi:hypothetical protein
MTKVTIKNLLSKWNVLAIALVAMMSIGLSSCNGDDDPDVIIDRGDFYYSFELVDRGTFSDADANKLIGELTASMPTYTAYSQADAVYRYDKEIENLRVGFSGSNAFEISFRVKLMCDKKIIKSKVVKVYRSGCTVE